MNDSTQLRNFTARNALSQILDSRLQLHQSILRRNLRHVLDRHELELSQLNQPDASATSSAMVVNEQSTTGWEYPAAGMLDEHARGHKPVLSITTLCIGQPSPSDLAPMSSMPSLVPIIDSVPDITLPDWLPQPADHVFSLPCQVRVTITPLVPGDLLYSETRNAKIILRSIASDRQVLDVKLDRHFLIELDKLFVTVESISSDGRSYWKRAVTDRYVLEISIRCFNSLDASQLLRQLGGQHRAADDVSASKGVLMAAWDDLPECPEPLGTLSLKLVEGQQSFLLEHRLEVVMGWNSPESDLTRYNRALQRPENRLQLPTPSASDDLEKISGKRSVSYKFRERFNVREIVTDDLRCIHCKADHEYPSFARLFLHYKTHHQLFTYKPDDSQWMDSDDAKIVVWIEATETTTSVEQRERDQNINWIAPVRPFDIVDYLRGAGAWASQNQHKQRSPVKKMGRPARREPALNGLSAKSSSLLRVRRTRRLAPEEVMDLPAVVRKRYRVPVVPDVTFFRTTSKQAICDDAELSESDDAVDETWFFQRQRRDLCKLGEDVIARDFHELWDLHLQEERPTSDMFIQDAVIRFVRKHKERLAAQDWLRHLQRKLTQLETGRVITKAAMDHCLAYVASEPRKTGGEVPLHKHAPNLRPEITTCSLPRRLFADKSQKPEKMQTSSLSSSRVIPETPSSERLNEHDAREDIMDIDRSPGKRTRWIKGRMVLADEGGKETNGGLAQPLCKPLTLSQSLMILEITRPGVLGAKVTKHLFEHADHHAQKVQRSDKSVPSEPAMWRPIRWDLLVNAIEDTPLTYDSDHDRIAVTNGDDGDIQYITCQDDFSRVIETALHSEAMHIRLRVISSRNSDQQTNESDPIQDAQRSLNSSNCAVVEDLDQVAEQGCAVRSTRQVSLRLKDACICGKPATGLRGVITCADAKCTRCFHLQCIGLQRRTIDWRCNSCTSALPPAAITT